LSAQGIIFIDLVGLGLVLAILNLVRTHKLHTAFAVVWLFAIGSLIVIVSVPPFLSLVTVVVGARFPASAVSLLAFMFVMATLIFFSVQLSLLSARQVEMAQAFALERLAEQERLHTELNNWQVGDGADGSSAAPHRG
jgi:hypothetical protein